jgi:hypothetical protein
LKELSPHADIKDLGEKTIIYVALNGRRINVNGRMFMHSEGTDFKMCIINVSRLFI